jgi:hypothetical protein
LLGVGNDPANLPAGGGIGSLPSGSHGNQSIGFIRSSRTMRGRPRPPGW